MSSNKRSNILILSGGQRYFKKQSVNIGDIAQLEHALELLSEHFPLATKTLVAHSLNDTAPFTHLSYSRAFISYLLQPRHNRAFTSISFFLRYILLFSMAHFPGIRDRLLPKRHPIHHVVSEIRSAKFIFITGSGTFSDRYFKGTASIWSCYISCASALNIPVVALGQQIGPLERPLAKILMGWALRKMHFLGVRDRKSLAVAETLGVDPVKLYFTGDEGGYLAPAKDHRVEDLFQRYGITLPIIVAQFRLDENCPLQDFAMKYAEILSALSKRMDAMVVFVPFSYALKDDDREHCFTIARNLMAPCVVLDTEEDSSLIKGVISKASMAIGVANHFCVFAVTAGVPTIGMYKTPYMKQKLEGIETEYSALKAISTKEVRNSQHTVEEILSHLNKIRSQKLGPSVHKPDNYYKWLEEVG